LPNSKKRRHKVRKASRESWFSIKGKIYRKLVFIFAEKNCIPHRFNRDTTFAGKIWLRTCLLLDRVNRLMTVLVWLGLAEMDVGKHWVCASLSSKVNEYLYYTVFSLTRYQRWCQSALCPKCIINLLVFFIL
jgi:hypothetical protein